MSQKDNTTRILDAAERLLGRYGYRKMTIDDIAAEAGIGKGTVYLSFRSKEDVVLGTVDRIVDRVCEAMAKVAASDKPAPDKLRAMLLSRVTVRFEAVRDYGQSLNDLLAFVREGLLQRRTTHFEREAKLLGEVVRRGQLSGALDAPPAVRTARALILATNSFLPYALSPAELGDAKRLRRDANDVIHLLIDAITKEIE